MFCSFDITQGSISSHDNPQKNKKIVYFAFMFSCLEKSLICRFVVDFDVDLHWNCLNFWLMGCSYKNIMCPAKSTSKLVFFVMPLVICNDVI